MRAEFPPEFDAAEYRTIHADLWPLSEEELARHFAENGEPQGRCANRLRTREQFRDLALGCRSLLEIGPFSRPLYIGNGVSYFDVMDRAGLMNRARDDVYYRPDSIPEIHYVSPTGDLSVVPARFDVVASSHVIEHLPDLAGHLNQVTRLLETGGYYFLWIPDKRYCFDAFQPESAMGAVIEAAVEGRATPTLGTAVAQRFDRSHNDSQRHWRGDHGQPAGLDHQELASVVARYYEPPEPGEHLDLHAWQFTPGSFRRIVEELRQLRFTALRSVRIYSTRWGSNEFWAILESAPVGDPSPLCATSWL